MASRQFMLRVQNEDGTYLIEDLNDTSTISDLKQRLSDMLNIPVDNFKILSGYPPRALITGVDTSTLKDASISSGETLRIQKIASLTVHETETATDVSLKPVIDTGASGDHAFFPENVLQSSPGIMMRRVVPSNNSCLFASVYFLLSNGELDDERSTDLRRVIAQAVAGNPDKYNSAFLGMSNGDYCIWIQNNDHWGGAIELSVLSEHFGFEIVAVDTISLKMHRFGENENYVNRIFLIYDGIHYDPLVLEISDGTTQTIFSVSDSYALEMAMEVAREAKSSRQYTDVANFTLRCMICDVHLRGDAEARSHAASTGHVNFGEVNRDR